MNFPLSDADWHQLPAHPRLFANIARFEALRGQQDTVSRQLKELLRDNVEQRLAAAPDIYPTEGEMGVGRDTQRRIITLAMWFRLLGDRRCFERARRDLLQLAARPNWGTHHFLDVGEASLAAAIGLDWLYDELAPTERDHIADAIVNRALVPSLDAVEGNNDWVDADYNWNQVCNAGLAVGAIAVAERAPELSRRIVHRGIKNLPNAVTTYAPDGSYPEGPLYWSYGTSHHVLMIEALRGAFGTSCGLESSPGFLESAQFALQVIGPSGEGYSFSDSGVQNENEPILLWFARELGRRELAQSELDLIARRADALTSAEKTFRYHRHFSLELLWWNPDLPATDAILPLHWTARGHMPMAVMRSAWNNPRATYLAMKGGTPNHSHGHMDAGSFILEADGVRWALDLGREDYDKMRAAKLDLWNYSQDSSRWTTFRVGPESHNIPRFDGARQNIQGKAEVRALPDENGVMGDVVQLSPLYENQIESIERTVKLFADRSVFIEDAWKAGARAVEYSFQWLTTARVTRSARGLRLEQAGESLELQVASPDEFHIEVEDVSQARAPQDSPNPGLRRILIRQKTAASSIGTLKVKAVPGSVR